MIIGINASRARSGGAKMHLIQILSNLDVKFFGFQKIHVWADQNLLNDLPNKNWLCKHSPNIKKFILFELLWEYLFLPKKLIDNKCDILFNVDAGSLCQFSPSVTLNQDILCFEKNEFIKLNFGFKFLRQFILKSVQLKSLLNSNGSIFLTKYAHRLISRNTKKKFNSTIVIPHGIQNHSESKKNYSFKKNYSKPIKCLYVSPIWIFKNQWNVVKAVAKLREKGFNINLKLIGSLKDNSYKLLENELNLSDPKREFVEVLGHLNHDQLDIHYKSSDIFIFASSCESFGITLLEAMSYGLPIACSKLSSMPETLRNSGVYFNPDNYFSIMQAIKNLIINEKLRKKMGSLAKDRSKMYCWKKTSNDTFAYIRDIALKFNFHKRL